MSPANLARIAAIVLVLLFMLCLTWESRLAPLRPGGSWLVLKALPLLMAIPGILQGRRYTFQWVSMLSIAYFAEGIVRGFSEPAPASTLAAWELLLALALFASTVTYARRTRQSVPARSPVTLGD